LKRGSRAALCISLLSALALVYAVPASAAESPPSVPVTQPSTLGGTPGLSDVVLTLRPTAGNSLEVVITCTPNIQYPHASSGNVNIHMTVSCTQEMTYIQVDIQLYYVGIAKVGDSGLQTRFLTNYSDQHANSTGCTNGYYQGWGYFYVWCALCWPNEGGSSSGWGPINYVQC